LESISIVIPAYNEESRLAEALTEALARGFHEVLVVDDGSTDGTAALAGRFQREDSRVRLLVNPGNRGKGYSVRRGMLEARGRWILFSDADLSAPVDEVLTLSRAAEQQEAAVAIGSRALDRSLIGVHQSSFRETAGRIFNFFVRLLTGLPVLDTQCGFKLFEAAAAREIFRRQRIDRFGFDVEVLFIARRLGYRIVEVPVKWSHSKGTKVSMFRDSLNMFLDLARVRWNALLGRYR